MEIHDLTPFERKVWDAFPRGQDVEFADADGEKADQGESWGPERSVRAEVIRRLLVIGHAAEGGIASLRLTGIRITGRLDLKHATAPYAVRFWNCYFDHIPNLYAMRVQGQIRLADTTVTGTINLDNADLNEPSRTVFDAENLTVGANLTAWRLHATGRINLRGAKIPGQLNLWEARLSNPDGVALRATRCIIGELWLAKAMPIAGSVNLRGSQLGLLHIPPEVWPTHVKLDGLTYTSLAPRLPANRRLPALERDEDGYVPRAYEQLAAAYRRVGDDARVRAV